MVEDLNRNFALAKQAFDELIDLVPLDQLADQRFGEGDRRVRVEHLLKQLNSYIQAIQTALTSVVISSNEPPLLSVPPTHRRFWADSLGPNVHLLRRAYFQASGQALLAELFDFVAEDTSPSSSKVNAISWALERWSDGLEDDDERYQWVERGFDIEGARDLVGMPWFQPDAWVNNLHCLEPLLIDRPEKVIRDHVRYRLVEIYRAFMFGLWMSSIALSRSLVEFSLRANAPRFSVSTTFEGTFGSRLEDKSLKRLGDELALILPTMSQPLEVVRGAGNRILHPKKHDVIAHPAVMQQEALACIQAARFIVACLYSEAPDTSR